MKDSKLFEAMQTLDKKGLSEIFEVYTLAVHV